MTTSSTTDTYAYAAGLEAGRAFLDPATSLERVFAHERHEMAKELRDAAINLERVELRREWRAQKLAANDGRHGSRRALLERLTDERDEKPAAYSRIRGILYIGFALFILIADFAILAQVIARVFGFTSRAKGLGDPASALFRSPTAAIDAFGEVYLTTLGVLLIAMAFKVWNDRAPRKPLPPQARLADRMARFLEDHTQWIVLGIAVLSIVVIAYVRIQVDVGRISAAGAESTPEAQRLLRWVTAIIGLACPVVGVLLFSRGLEALGGGQRIKNLEKTTSGLENKTEILRKEWEAHTEEHVEKEKLKQFLDRPDEMQLRLRLAEDHFRLGYVAGVTETIGSAGLKGTYRNLRLRFPIQ